MRKWVDSLNRQDEKSVQLPAVVDIRVQRVFRNPRRPSSLDAIRDFITRCRKKKAISFALMQLFH